MWFDWISLIIRAVVHLSFVTHQKFLIHMSPAMQSAI